VEERLYHTAGVRLLLYVNDLFAVFIYAARGDHEVELILLANIQHRKNSRLKLKLGLTSGLS